MYARFTKRWIDLVIAVAALVILSPLFAVIALAVRMFLGSPVVFRQVRAGFDEQPFSLYKFRSMSDQRDALGSLLPDAERLTAFGRFLRRTSLDELPELINVVKGEMSVIGPRPLLLEYLPYYTDAERARHRVKPGLTGLAQTQGRNALGWSARLRHDAEYVQSLSLRNDIRIALDTFGIIVRGHGVNASESVTSSRLDDERRASPVAEKLR